MGVNVERVFLPGAFAQVKITLDVTAAGGPALAWLPEKVFLDLLVAAGIILPTVAGGQVGTVKQCPLCNGTGNDPSEPLKVCGECGGAMVITVWTEPGDGGGVG